MKEDFLHYLWQHQYFRKEALQTTSGEAVQVLHPGQYNRSDAGPDFFNARLLLDQTEWIGSVEIHLKATDWRRHQHQHDAKYNQVILHVVWEEDGEILREEGTPIPTVELKDRVNLPLQATYQALLWSQETIPCASQVHAVDAIYKSAMLDKTLLERLAVKADVILARMDRSQQDWECTVYQTLAYGFGFKINQNGFLQLADALPWPLVMNYRQSPGQLEALVFGQAGFLQDVPPDNSYLQKLSKEHRFLAYKHTLPSALPMKSWNMLRLRPANFPAVRLGQFLAVLQAHAHLWSGLKDCTSLPAFVAFLRKPAPLYWQQHYAPGKKATNPFVSIGQESVFNLLINVVAPLLMAYGRRTDNFAYQAKAIALLESLPKEKNRILRLYDGLGFPQAAAADSQALLGLYHSYCNPRKCVHCTIGHRLLKQNLL